MTENHPNRAIIAALSKELVEASSRINQIQQILPTLTRQNEANKEWLRKYKMREESKLRRKNLLPSPEGATKKTLKISKAKKLV